MAVGHQHYEDYAPLMLPFLLTLFILITPSFSIFIINVFCTSIMLFCIDMNACEGWIMPANNAHVCVLHIYVLDCMEQIEVSRNRASKAWYLHLLLVQALVEPMFRFNGGISNMYCSVSWETKG